MDRDERIGSEDGAIRYPSGKRLWFLTIGLMAVVLMVALDNYILGGRQSISFTSCQGAFMLTMQLATAIPTISTQFHSLDLVGWYASSYFLTQMAFQPAFGHLFTDYAIKRVFVAAITLFELGSIVCASANGSIALIVGRLIAGAGGGGLYVGTLTLMGLAVPIRARPFYISLVTSMFGVASVAGPLLGAIGFVAMVLLVFTFEAPVPTQSDTPKSRLTEKLWRLDPVGLVLLIAAFVCLMLALQWAGVNYPWSSARVLGCLLGFGLLILAFLVIQLRRQDKASIPLWLARQRTVAAVRGLSARASGVHNLPFLATMLFSPIVSGALISVVGYYVPFMWLGAILASVGSGLLYTVREDSGSGLLSTYQLITGLGLGICTQIPFTAVQHMLRPEHLTMGSALVSFCNSLGPILGTNVGQAIFSNVLVKRLEGAPNIDAKAIVMGRLTNVGEAGTPAAVREAINFALTRTYILAIVGGVLAFGCSTAMEWGNVKSTSSAGGARESVQIELDRSKTSNV
ncbi:MAG: hypothetical protein Q9222_000951 [Ikaeria aurantiellina]